MLTFGKTDRDQGFMYGFKHKKCLKLFLKDVKSISGYFEDDQISGKTIIDFFDGTTSIGFARNNRLIGVLKNVLPGIGNAPDKVNITTVDGKILTFEDEFGFIRFLDGRTVVMNKESKNVYNCLQQDYKTLKDCYKMKVHIYLIQ